ncbi:PEP-CTERM sorting domain-containing protein [Candidatus Auribacterota bacterium]
MRNAKMLIAVAALIMVLPLTAFSDTHTWTGETSEYWDVATNWVDDSLPENGDTLNFVSSMTRYTSNNNSYMSTVDKIEFDPDEPFTLSGSALTYSGPGDDTIIQSTSQNTLISLDYSGSNSNNYIDVAAGQITFQGTVSTGTPGMTFRPNGSGKIIIGGPIGGSTVTMSGSGTLEINYNDATYTGATTVNNGTLDIKSNDISSSSSTSVGHATNHPVLKGAGTVGVLNITSNGTVSPGNSVGTMNAGNTTWDQDGIYQWEINDADGTAGTDPGWDLLDITGGLTVAATSGNTFEIEIVSLNGTSPGNCADFDNSQNYTWKIATASGGVSGYSADKFSLESSGFTNDTGVGFFSVSQTGNDVNLVFTAVPEPSTYFLFGLGLFGMVVGGLRRFRKKITV